MERHEIGKSGDGFIDRSKVRILLCDNDTKSSQEVLTLLCKCSYQVTSVRSARQVIDALNAEGPDVDIILSEVDLPMAKGLKMLKYIMRDKELRRIPVIMMSPQDEVSVVVKCLRLGAADYLVKPLRTNELLNLWTHMWRRRQMLGLAEKNILSYDFDLAASDPSDANTNSTTLFSDDTDDKSRKSAIPEISITTQQQVESYAAPAATRVEPPVAPKEYRYDVPEISVRRTGQISSFPKKSELKIGESSAFFTYVKSSMVKGKTEDVVSANESGPHQHSVVDKKKRGDQVGHAGNDSHVEEITRGRERERENHRQGDEFPGHNNTSESFLTSSSVSPPPECSLDRNSKIEELSQQVRMHQRDGYHRHDAAAAAASGFHAHTAYPYYIPGMMNQVMMASPSAQMYQKNLQDLQNCATSAMLSQYNNHITQCRPPPPHVPGMMGSSPSPPPPPPPPSSYPYYPVNVCLQPTQPWSSSSSYGNSSSNEGVGKVDRREAALMKFRQKRKERCFDKKIRYVNRKRLAEKRPRVRGQFVRKVNGVKVDLNGQPAAASGDFEDEEEEEEEEEDYSPENDTIL